MTYKDKKIRHLELENSELRMVLKYMIDRFPVAEWVANFEAVADDLPMSECRKQKVIIQSLFSLNILETPDDSDNADLPVCIRCGITVSKSAISGRRKPMCGKCYLRKKKEERRNQNA